MLRIPPQNLDLSFQYDSFLTVYFPSCSSFPQEMCGEVEVLMERMKQLQECRDDEEASQEEMATRFEREKTESMLVVTAEDDECVPSRDISRHFEDPSYGYKDFSRRGEHVPTFRVQVEIKHRINIEISLLKSRYDCYLLFIYFF